MRGDRWLLWAINRPTDAERLCAWLVRRHRLTSTTIVTTRDALRASPIKQVRRLDSVLRELAGVGALQVWRRGRERTIDFDPSEVGRIAATAMELFPDVYRAPP
jgi:hypothetical protein